MFSFLDIMLLFPFCLLPFALLKKSEIRYRQMLCLLLFNLLILLVRRITLSPFAVIFICVVSALLYIISKKKLHKNDAFIVLSISDNSNSIVVSDGRALITLQCSNNFAIIPGEVIRIRNEIS